MNLLYRSRHFGQITIEFLGIYCKSKFEVAVHIQQVLLGAWVEAKEECLCRHSVTPSDLN
jgi:hypothetical protein